MNKKEIMRWKKCKKETRVEELRKKKRVGECSISFVVNMVMNEGVIQREKMRKIYCKEQHYSRMNEYTRLDRLH